MDTGFRKRSCSTNRAAADPDSEYVHARTARSRCRDARAFHRVAGTLRNVVIRGATQNAADVVLAGKGMNNSLFGDVPSAIVSEGSVQNLATRVGIGRQHKFTER